MRKSPSLATIGAVVLITLIPGTAATATSGDLTRVSRGDPFSGCTIGAAPTSTRYRGAEVEPFVTTHNRRPQSIVGAWQQNRWSDGGANGLVTAYSRDGGRSFHRVVWPVSRCARGGLNYERATDPWVSMGPDGTVYGSSLSFDQSTPRNAIVALTSRNGGRTYRNVTEVIADTSPRFFNDKNSVTADPARPGSAYQVWDRLESSEDGQSFVEGPTFISVTRDFGRTWSRPFVIVDTAPFQQTIGNVIVGDQRTGALYNFYTSIQYTDATASAVVFVRFEVVRSDDGGRTWGRPVVIAPENSVLDVNPNNPDQVLRTGSLLPSAAIDPRTGTLYMAYGGTDFTDGTYNQIQLVRSTNGGRTWSLPVLVSRDLGRPAFTPSIAVTQDGDVGVTYYDLRTLGPGNTTTLPTSTLLTVSPRGGDRFGRERRIAPIFDHALAPNAGGFFVGDYEGLASVDDKFRALFVTTNRNQPDNPTDVFYGQFRSFEFPHQLDEVAPFQRAGAAAPPRAVTARPLRSRR